MGLLKHLLFWPVTGPTFLTRFSLEKVGETAREELTNDQAVKEELLALQMRLELEEIDDEEYLVQEAALMQQLRDVRYWREQFGMGAAGGPVRVAASGETGEIAEPTAPSREAEISDGESDAPDPGRIALPGEASVEIAFDWDDE